MDSNASSLRTASPLLLLPVLALGSLASEPVFGQAGARPVIEEITVTARRREESLQSIPVAVTAFSATDIVDRQIRALEDVARYSPGLSFAKAFGRSTDRPVIRGQGNVLAGVQFGVESGAAYFVDGIYYPGDLSSLDLNNIERIEVVRGPQSALYGRNTYSGAINFITKEPGDELSADVRTRWGDDQDIEVSGVVRGPLIDGVLGGSLAMRYYTYDGEYLNTVTGKTVGDEETKSISGTLDWTPAADWRVRSRLSYQEDRDGTRPFFLQGAELNNCLPGTRSMASWPITGSTNNNQYFCGKINRPGDTVALNDGPARPGWPGPSDLFPGIPNVPFGGQPVYNPANGLPFSGVNRDLLFASLLSEWDIAGSGFVLTTSLGYRDEERKTGSDSDHSQINRLTNGRCTFCASEVDEFEDISAEVRLESPSTERLRWLAGAYYFDQDSLNRNVTFAQLNGGAPRSERTIRNWAIFGSVEFDFTDRVTATAELRYFDEEKGLKEYTFVDYDNDPSQRTTTFDESVDFSEFAPRVTVNWQVLDDILLYANWSQGYKPGGLNGAAGNTVVPARPEYLQESADSYEIGAKTNWLNNRLQANLALFFIDSKDIQLTTALSTGAGTLTSIVTNQGSGETFGGELELTFAVTDTLTVGANYALADTKFTKGCDQDQYIFTSGGGNLLDAATCTGNNVNGNGDGSIKGKAFPLSSKNQVGAFADYRRPIRSQAEFFANLGFSWEDKKPVQVHNQAFVPSATILDLKLGIENERLTVAVYGRNLTDEDAPNMVTRWLQDPLVFGQAGFPSTANTAPAGACAAGTGGCSTVFPRAFFGDFRRSRNFGIEFAWRFGG
jgi:outer membrane receptor protein involved in Fe transport